MSSWQASDIDAAKAGDLNAYERVIHASMRMVTSIALSIVKDVDASEDIAQQVYISVWQKLAALKNSTSFLPWLRELTRNTALNYIRDNKLNARAGEVETDALFATLLDEQGDLESNLQREQQSAILRKLIEQLPEDSREVILLYYREEQSSVQVATLLDLEEATVRQRLSRARALLKDGLLGQYGKILGITGPGVIFVSLTSSLLSASSPAVASTTALLASKNMSGLGKFMILLGGAGIGALGGVLGVWLGASTGIRKAPTQALKQHLRVMRNLTALWVVTAGVLLFAAYEYTSGWIAPLLAYTLFYIVLAALVLRVQKVVMSDEYLKPQGYNAQSAGARIGSFFCRYAIWGAGLFGFAGLFIGLLRSGRLVLG